MTENRIRLHATDYGPGNDDATYHAALADANRLAGKGEKVTLLCPSSGVTIKDVIVSPDVQVWIGSL